jgi:hypothetical protein
MNREDQDCQNPIVVRGGNKLNHRYSTFLAQYSVGGNPAGKPTSFR